MLRLLQEVRALFGRYDKLINRVFDAMTLGRSDRVIVGGMEGGSDMSSSSSSTDDDSTISRFMYNSRQIITTVVKLFKC